MLTLGSSVLIVQHPHPEQVQFGADFAEDFEYSLQLLKQRPYKVIIYPVMDTEISDCLQYGHYLRNQFKNTEQIVVASHLPEAAIIQLLNRIQIIGILDKFNSSEFEPLIAKALERHQDSTQTAELLWLIDEQNQALDRFKDDLELRVSQRETNLAKAQKRLVQSNHRLSLFHKALIAIERSGSIGEIELKVTQALQKDLGIEWLRFQHSTQPILNNLFSSTKTNTFFVFDTGIFKGSTPLGQALFAKQSKFSREEKSFLSQLAEPMALAIDRLVQMENSESLKQQWVATFDAITDPLALINHEYKVVRANKAFAEKAKTAPEMIPGNSCHQLLFKRNEPCSECQIGKNFSLSLKGTPSQPQTYEVLSQKLLLDQELYVNLYRDISDQKLLEQQILDSAKMAELGTISSSIAHEINNPLGGVLSFIQLAKMDLDGESSAYPDLVQMEEATIRCKEIVQNLLVFSRKDEDNDSHSNICEVLRRAIKITELQTKSKGITIDLTLPDSDCWVAADGSSLSQILRFFLHHCHHAVCNVAACESESHRVLSVFTGIQNQTIRVTITDNGIGILPEYFQKVLSQHSSYRPDTDSQPMNYSVSTILYILHKIKGSVNIYEKMDKKLGIEILFPRPETQP